MIVIVCANTISHEGSANVSSRENRKRLFFGFSAERRVVITVHAKIIFNVLRIP